jgi:cysteinyl-tRNA synthetase
MVTSENILITANTPPHPDKTGRREWSESDSGHVTGVRVINSLLNHDRLVPLKTREPDTVTWYTCGPTVYDHAHLGHARNYVTVDILHRVLKEFFRLDVYHVLGMTDIDDKILNRARDQQVSPVTLARQFEREFFADMRAMNVQAPTVVTRVSEHVPEIQQFVEQITKNGYAYKAASDSVYFDVTAFQQQHYYGKLKPEVNLVPESDPDQAGQEKRAARDFALWKSQDGGRPGWHIECVAMSHAILGKHFDVHSGGIDLKFPHHNNEVAIADAYLNGDRCQHASDTAHEWVNYFLHVGHLNIKGLKMSKSLKNFITVKVMARRVRELTEVMAIH